jgi:hypothetical protein
MPKAKSGTARLPAGVSRGRRVTCPHGQGAPSIKSPVIYRSIPRLYLLNALHRWIRRIGLSVRGSCLSDFTAPPRGTGIHGHNALDSRALQLGPHTDHRGSGIE